MAGLVMELVGVLNEQSEVFEELIRIADNKKELIIKNDVDGLRIISTEESGLVGKSQKLEKKCETVMKDIARVLNTNPKNVNLSVLADIIKEQDEHGDLTAAAERIRKTADLLRASNEDNKALIESALEYIDFSINVLRSSVEAVPAAYSAGDDGEPTATMIDIKE
jgi:flagellar biosynthesis/type III secretory pathway chaperone